MSDDKKEIGSGSGGIKESENLGDDSCRVDNEWFKQSQKDPRFNIELAKARIKQDREFGANYYGGVL